MENSILLFGGSSEERLVSVASAQNISKEFEFSDIWFIHQDGRLSKVDKSELLSHQDAFVAEFKAIQSPFSESIEKAIFHLKEKKVFLALHGTEGEDGSIQAYFESSKVAFTGSGSISSANAFNKDKAKTIVSRVGIQVAPQIMIDREMLAGSPQLIVDFFEKHRKIVLKPLANGSSIGLHVISDLESLLSAIESISTKNYSDYLAEKFVQGRELTVGVYDDSKSLKALPPSEVILKVGHSFDYNGKYLGHGTTEVTPAELSLHEVESVQLLAKQAHEALACFGYSRTDIMLTPSGPVFMETNTLPGLTKASFVPQQLKAAGIGFRTFIESQLRLSQRR